MPPPVGAECPHRRRAGFSQRCGRLGVAAAPHSDGGV